MPRLSRKPCPWRINAPTELRINAAAISQALSLAHQCATELRINAAAILGPLSANLDHKKKGEVLVSFPKRSVDYALRALQPGCETSVICAPLFVIAL
jgi:hypothetical protein